MMRYIWLILALTPVAKGQSAPSWFVEPGYALQIDASDLSMPTGITFLNKPGSEPDDVLYLVAELRGDIKAVTNKREVKLFARTPDLYVPKDELPSVMAEIGQIGICINQDDSKLFSTTVGMFGKSKKQRINKIIQWESSSKWRSGAIVSELADVFSLDHTATAHQIQNCMIDSQGKLWVGVGDGKTADNSHKLTSSLGKVLRMNQDFSGVVDNPFYSATETKAIKNLIYVYGVRNPAGIAEGRDGKMYVADNGNSVDRLLQLQKGKEYPWDNTDTSFTYGSMLVWPKTVGPSAMIYVKDNPLFPELNDHLLVAASFEAALYAVPIKPDTGVSGNPRKLFYQTQDPAKSLIITGLAMGPDGIYASILRTTSHAPENLHKNERARMSGSTVVKLIPAKQVAAEQVTKSPAQLLEDANCRGCHVIDAWGGKAGPELDSLIDRLPKRLDNDDYRKKLAKILEDNPEFAQKYTSVVNGIVARDGLMGDRMQQWIEMKIDMPNFDNPDASMAQLNLSPEIRKIIAAEIVRITDSRKTKEKEITYGDKWRIYMEKNRIRDKARGFGAGVGLSAVLFLAVWLIRRRRAKLPA